MNTDEEDYVEPEDRAAWSLAESNLTYPTCEAVGHCPRPTVDSAPFHHFYNDHDRDAERMEAIHERGRGHDDAMSEYAAVVCKTCSRRALVHMDADDLPEI